MKQLVIYHGKCIDGFTAAWCAWLKFGEQAEYYPGTFGEPAPDATGRDVLIVDFSYPRNVLLAMKREANTLRVLDHHKTAQRDLEGLDFCLFDMERSGAGLTWDELTGIPREYAPLVNYVEDRDLWRFKLLGSKSVNALVGATEQTFSAYSELNELIMSNPCQAVELGGAVLKGVDRYVKEMAGQARLGVLAGHTVPVVNAPYINTSELVGYLAEINDLAPFAVGWYQRSDGKYAYSLRSRGAFDVSEVAKLFGGGGHKNAAGFSVAQRVDL